MARVKTLLKIQMATQVDESGTQVTVIFRVSIFT